MAVAKDVANALRQATNPGRAVLSLRFFKAGPGEYAEGDKFLGNSVPQIRVIAKKFRDLSLSEIDKLMTSTWHEERLLALFILVDQFKRGSEADKKIIYDYYVAHTKNINNWDLVDGSAGHIVGEYLEGKPEKLEVLTRLAYSDLLWERRIAMLATFTYIMKGQADEAFIIIKILLNDKHDLIQKATGWMLREIGKRIPDGKELLSRVLNTYGATMPRTTLRYAIEHFTPEERKRFMSLKGVK